MPGLCKLNSLLEKSTNMKFRPSRKAVTVFICAAAVASMLVIADRVDFTKAAPRIDQQLAVPAYANPLVDPGSWQRLAASDSGSVGFAVINVFNGTDYTPSPAAATAIQNASARGLKLVGYVDTGYLGTTGRSTRLGSTDATDWVAQIQQDIAAWYQLYGSNLAGIFFDQTQNACGPTPGSNDWADRYRLLSDEVKRLHSGALTVVNPGIGVAQCYEDVADVIVTFEGSYESYVDDPAATNPYAAPNWVPADPRKIWHIVYGASDVAKMNHVVELSRTRGAGNIYVTDDVLPNPYDTLPPADYWIAEEASTSG